MSEEILDLVSPDDVVIGSDTRSNVNKNKLSNFRAANAFIVNDEGKFWIPRRNKNKKLFPNALDTSVGGCVSSGEGYEEAFLREAEEEIGLKLQPHQYKFICPMNPHTDGTSAFMHVYLIYYNEVPPYNPEDFSSYYWLTGDEILERLKNGDTSKDDLPRIVRKLKELGLTQ